MSVSPAHSVANYLASIGVGEIGGALDWAINVTQLSEMPIRTLAVVDSPGMSPLLYDADLRRPGVQVIGRCEDYEELWLKMDEIHRALVVDGLSIVVGAYRFVGFDSSGDILALGQDEKGNFLLSANYAAIRHPVVVA